MNKILSLLLLLLHSVAGWAQFHNPVQFAVEQRKVSDSEIEVVFTGKVAAGWHVYGTDIQDGGPTRAEVTLEKQRGLKPKGPLKATGKVHRSMDALFGMEVSYMEGTASFAQRFTLTGGDYEVAGYLTYGACNDQNCTPPTTFDFNIFGQGVAAQAAPAADKVAETSQVESGAVVEPAEEPQEAVADSSVAAPAFVAAEASGWWTPVVDVLQSFGGTAAGADTQSAGWLLVFALGFLGGLAALVTPCVWPIIPMTVSFFLKRSKDDRAKGVRDALTYGASIVVIYVTLGLLVTFLFGASALNSLSTHAVFNIFFFLMLVFFGASFLGGFDLTLPSSWSNAVNSKAGNTSGLLSIFLMAFTLTLVSFSCTGPIIGFLLVEVSTSGSILGPAVGMLGFALALALPFTLFALFPSWIKKAPKSGNWMNNMKVTLGFLELAFSLKFLSVADLAYGWGILDREVFLSLWIVLFALLGAYLIGWIRFPHDEDEYDEIGEVVLRPRTSVARFFLGVGSLAFALYMVPGLWGSPVKAVSAFAPPMSTQDFNLNPSAKAAHFSDYEEGMAYAAQHGKPVLLDFTGYGCVNCRKMEASVWTDARVREILDKDYVLITLYVDEKTPLPEVQTVTENGQKRKLRTVGDKWSYLQRYKFGANAQPFYVVVDNAGRPLNRSYSFDEDVQHYIDWLQAGLTNYSK